MEMFNEIQCNRYNWKMLNFYEKKKLIKRNYQKNKLCSILVEFNFFFCKLRVVKWVNNIKERICGFRLKKWKCIKTEFYFNRNYIVYTKRIKRGIVAYIQYTHELMNKISFSIMLNRIVKYREQ